LELMLLTVIPCCILAALSSEQFTEVVGTNDPADVPAAAAWLSEPPVKYNADFTSPLPLIYERALLNADLTKRVATPPPNTWVLESQSNSSVAKTTVSHDHPGGILNISNNGDHCVLWLNKNFPSADYVLSFGVEPKNTSEGLNIVFFSTTAITRGNESNQDIFGLHLPPRAGNYGNYTCKSNKGCSIQNYGMSYYRIGTGLLPGQKDVANLRKNPGFHLVAGGVDLIGLKPNHVFNVVVSKVGPNIAVTVDGSLEAAWADDGTLDNGVYNGGYIGLRQMQSTVWAAYHYLSMEQR